MRKVRMTILVSDLTPAGGYLGVSGATPIAKPQFSIVVVDETPTDEGKEAGAIMSSTIDLAKTPDASCVQRMREVDIALAAVRKYLYDIALADADAEEKKLRE